MKKKSFKLFGVINQPELHLKEKGIYFFSREQMQDQHNIYSPAEVLEGFYLKSLLFLQY